MISYTKKEWEAKAIELFGPNPMQWKFVCPVCQRETTVQEWQEAGAPENAVAFSCVGRWRDDVDCDYAGGGLFKLNPVVVTQEDGSTAQAFAFAGSEETSLSPGTDPRNLGNERD